MKSSSNFGRVLGRSNPFFALMFAMLFIAAVFNLVSDGVTGFVVVDDLVDLDKSPPVLVSFYPESMDVRVGDSITLNACWTHENGVSGGAFWGKYNNSLASDWNRVPTNIPRYDLDRDCYIQTYSIRPQRVGVIYWRLSAEHVSSDGFPYLESTDIGNITVLEAEEDPDDEEEVVVELLEIDAMMDDGLLVSDIPIVTEDIPVIVSINEDEFSFSSVEFTSSKDVSDVRMEFRELDFMPDGVSDDTSGDSVYSIIELKKFELVDDDLFGNDVAIRFSVPKIWFDDNTVDYTTVVLNRWDDVYGFSPYSMGWEIMPTSFIEESGDVYIYDAVSNNLGLSTFAISGESKGATCSGVIELELSDLSVQPRAEVTASVTGLENCDGEDVFLQKNSCSSSEKIFTIWNVGDGDAMFNSDRSEGIYDIVACIDMDGDTISDSLGEMSTIVKLEVSEEATVDDDILVIEATTTTTNIGWEVLPVLEKTRDVIIDSRKNGIRSLKSEELLVEARDFFNSGNYLEAETKARDSMIVMVAAINDFEDIKEGDANATTDTTGTETTDGGYLVWIGAIGILIIAVGIFLKYAKGNREKPIGAEKSKNVKRK